MRADVAVCWLPLLLGTLRGQTLDNSADSPDVVRTTAGFVRGFQQTVLGKTIRTFTGIRYGKPPIGKRRFRAPEPAEPWDDIADATKAAPPCVQLHTRRASRWQIPEAPRKAREDCLFLNVWTPADLSSTSRLAIMVWIHGGGLYSGSSSMKVYDGAILSSFGDVVVVSINYRLAALGLLHDDGNSELAGNQAFLDQALALRWVKENAESFGGDPDRITLFGESGGSVSVEAHIISPVSKTLFKRAILQSGSLCGSAPIPATQAAHNLPAIAKFFNCANSSTASVQPQEDVINCLREADPLRLRVVERLVCPFIGSCFYPRHDDFFFPDGLCVTDEDGGKDILIGHVENEGAMFITKQFPDAFPRHRTPLNVGKVEMLYYLGMLLYERDPTFLDVIHRVYMGHLQDTDYKELRRALQDTRGDMIIVCPTIRASQRLAKANNVHFYVMNYTSQAASERSWYGMTHFDDMRYVFGRPLADKGPAADIEYSEKLMRLWTSFAKTGEANVDGKPWPKVNSDNMVALKLSNEPAEEAALDPHGRCRVWSR